VGIERDLRGIRLLVGVAHAREFLDLPSKCFGVHPLDITGHAHVERCIDEDFDKIRRFTADHRAYFTVRRDERRQHGHSITGKQLRDERDTLDVLVAVLLGKAQIACQALAHGIAVQPLDLEATRAQFLL
jgi:hypothetical protein